MGLDMYLSGTKCFTPFDYVNEDGEIKRINNIAYDVIASAAGGDPKPTEFGIITVQLPVLTWRKANQIHNWFVTECQGGVDECQSTSVQPDQLKELISSIEEALETRDSANLPPKRGFFFGSTEIDDDYWEDLEYTLNLKPFLEEERFESYVYQSSW